MKALVVASMLVAATARAEPPAFSVGKKGLGFESADGESSLYTHWLVAADFQTFLGDKPPGVTVRDAFVVRSAGLQLDAVVHRYVHSQLFVDFSQGRATLFDAWVQAELSPALNLRAGKFLFPISEERLTSPINLPFVSTSFASVLVPSRDIGVQAFGKLGDGLVAYNVALTDGATAGSLVDGETDSHKDVVGRIFVRPFKRSSIAPLQQLGIGIGASTGLRRGTMTAPSLPILRTYGGQTFFSYRGESVADGRVTRVVPHATWAWGPVAMYGDYVRVEEHATNAAVRAVAWSVIPSVVLTGERAAPLAFIIPAHPLDLRKGHIGTVLLTAGLGSIRIGGDAFDTAADPTTAMRKATVLGGGVKWYPYTGIAVLADYGLMWFDAAGDRPARPSEHTVITRVEMAL